MASKCTGCIWESPTQMLELCDDLIPSRHTLDCTSGLWNDGVRSLVSQ